MRFHTIALFAACILAQTDAIKLTKKARDEDAEGDEDKIEK